MRLQSVKSWLESWPSRPLQDTVMTRVMNLQKLHHAQKLEHVDKVHARLTRACWTHLREHLTVKVIVAAEKKCTVSCKCWPCKRACWTLMLHIIKRVCVHVARLENYCLIMSSSTANITFIEVSLNHVLNVRRDWNAPQFIHLQHAGNLNELLKLFVVCKFHVHRLNNIISLKSMCIVTHPPVSLNCKGEKQASVCPLQYTRMKSFYIADIQNPAMIGTPANPHKHWGDLAQCGCLLFLVTCRPCRNDTNMFVEHNIFTFSLVIERHCNVH